MFPEIRQVWPKSLPASTIAVRNRLLPEFIANHSPVSPLVTTNFQPTEISSFAYNKPSILIYFRLVMCHSTSSLHSVAEDVTSRTEVEAPPTEVKASISLLQRLQRLLLARLLTTQNDGTDQTEVASTAVSQRNCEYILVVEKDSLMLIACNCLSLKVYYLTWKQSTFYDCK